MRDVDSRLRGQQVTRPGRRTDLGTERAVPGTDQASGQPETETPGIRQRRLRKPEAQGVRFQRIDGHPTFTDVKSERMVEDSREAIREFMEEITEPEPQLQLRANGRVPRETLT